MSLTFCVGGYVPNISINIIRYSYESWINALNTCHYTYYKNKQINLSLYLWSLVEHTVRMNIFEPRNYFVRCKGSRLVEKTSKLSIIIDRARVWLINLPFKMATKNNKNIRYECVKSSIHHIINLPSLWATCAIKQKYSNGVTLFRLC